ncbi:WxL domain-containing protein [Enterococcus sp. LJL90]
MKFKRFITVLLGSLSLLALFYTGQPVRAASESNLSGNGTVDVLDTGVTIPVDPENPGVNVDPGEGPSTKGPLRFDFVSSLNFGLVELTDGDKEFHSLAQLFHSETGPRGYYVQVTDQRKDSSGWELQVAQDSQFNNRVIQTLSEQELAGAYLSFDNGWANSADGKGLPGVTRDTIKISEFNVGYTVATASTTQGEGVYTIAFGASAENTSGQTNTLTALTDADGTAVMDDTYNKQTYSNSAIKLFIPSGTKIYPVNYKTTLTWSLIAGPTE